MRFLSFLLVLGLSALLLLLWTPTANAYYGYATPYHAYRIAHVSYVSPIPLMDYSYGAFVQPLVYRQPPATALSHVSYYHPIGVTRYSPPVYWVSSPGFSFRLNTWQRSYRVHVQPFLPRIRINLKIDD